MIILFHSAQFGCLTGQKWCHHGICPFSFFSFLFFSFFFSFLFFFFSFLQSRLLLADISIQWSRLNDSKAIDKKKKEWRSEELTINKRPQKNSFNLSLFKLYTHTLLIYHWAVQNCFNLLDCDIFNNELLHTHFKHWIIVL